MFNPSASVALGLAAALVWPCASTASPSELSFQQALALARERAPALLDAAGRVAEAQGAVAGASPWLRDNPTLNAEVGPRRMEDGARGLQLSLGLAQPFELGGKQGARRESARAGLAREGAEQQDAERRVLGEVAASFLRALYAREFSRLMRDTEEAAKNLASSASKRFDAGDVPVVDVNVARVAQARAHAAVVVAEGEEEALLSELRAWLGLSLQEPLAVRGALRELSSLPVAAPTRASERADVRALESALAQAEAELRLGRAEALPDLSVGVRYEKEVDETAWLGTLSVPLPVFSRGQEAKVTGEARVRRLRTLLEAARRTRDVQVEAARIRDNRRQQALEVLEKEALPLLDENESLARRSYEAGEMDLAGLLLVRRETLETRVALLDSHLQAALARVQLAVETGVLP
ncbi:TolC family protein [Myxococcus qinghaiensis]|uniref:TolC family protein n=1 Tax=Myxococcus qinghaiensis TaxID=2906758 RepID=UPI0020A72158|nr:TolC family protein [Myxococcus qinghaiensis]MCP3164926.1 TolC family protein [Myxococcus qinghaiensis]